MGDVVSSHLDESKREIIAGRTSEVMGAVQRLYEQQYAVALFNKVRFDIEGGGGPQPQLLHRKIPLEKNSIFSGSIFQFQEDSKKWRNRFLLVPDSYEINVYDSKSSHDKHAQPKGSVNCAGYKVLSMEQYLELISNSLPGVKAKVGSSSFLKCPTQFPLLLWHPYSKHHCFCVTTEKEHQKWHAVLQDCVRHANDGLSEENKVQTPAFTDAVRLYRQAKGNYGTWEMMCGQPAQILSNLVMEVLHPELRDLISPRLKGKLHDRQRNWTLISDAVYSLVQTQCQAQYDALLQRCEEGRPALQAAIRTDMDQIITSKEYVSNKIRAVVLPKAEKLLKVSIEPYITSILDALMEPTSRGFAEVRDVFFRELVDMSKNSLNQGTKETVAQHMEKISMLAFHPVKMQSCYEKVESLSLEGLQQRFDVSSPSVFVQRAQILMREQMDDAVYTFEQLLHQSLESQGTDELCKTIQRCQDRVIKKFDYDSSTVRKRFFREALLQIFIPYMLKQLTPSCAADLPHFQELIFEDFSRFILVENIFEEVVLHSVMKDIMMAVKEAAVQRRHNLYRDSIVLSNSDPSLHLLGDNPSVDWAGEYGGEPKDVEETNSDGGEENADSQRKRRMKQVVSIIQVDGSPIIPESCLEVPGVEDIPEEEEGENESVKAKEVERGEKLENEVVPAKEEASDARLVEHSVEDSKPDGEKAAPCAEKVTGDAPTEETSNGIVQSDAKPAKEVPVSAEVAEEVKSPDVPAEDAKYPPSTVDANATEAAPSKTVDAVEAVVANGVETSPSKSENEDDQAASANLEESSDELLPSPPSEDNATEVPTQNGDADSTDGKPEGTADLLPPHDDSGFQSPTSDATEEEEVGNAQLKTVEEASDKEASQGVKTVEEASDKEASQGVKTVEEASDKEASQGVKTVEEASDKEASQGVKTVEEASDKEASQGVKTVEEASDKEASQGVKTVEEASDKEASQSTDSESKEQ
ncbi:protein Niban 2b isoform X2 [Eucyclogobius newberryi]|uniref:protein Niban 2b isoform X2 n=1 Tax=Eucyclogobius newberryi TaxID=166745 RepID=UPI003B5C9012